jgi:hypothetical protein
MTLWAVIARAYLVTMFPKFNAHRVKTADHIRTPSGGARSTAIDLKQAH